MRLASWRCKHPGLAALWEAMIAAVMRADLLSPLNSPKKLRLDRRSSDCDCVCLPGRRTYMARAQERSFEGRHKNSQEGTQRRISTKRIPCKGYGTPESFLCVVEKIPEHTAHCLRTPIFPSDSGFHTFDEAQVEAKPTATLLIVMLKSLGSRTPSRGGKHRLRTYIGPIPGGDDENRRALQSCLAASPQKPAAPTFTESVYARDKANPSQCLRSRISVTIRSTKSILVYTLHSEAGAASAGCESGDFKASGTLTVRQDEDACVALSLVWALTDDTGAPAARQNAGYGADEYSPEYKFHVFWGPFHSATEHC